MQKRSNYEILHDPIIFSDRYFLKSGIFHQSDRKITYLHTHTADEIGYCLSGSGIFIVDNRPFPFTDHDVVYIPAGMPHLAQSAPGTESSWIWFYADFPRLLLPHYPGFDLSFLKKCRNMDHLLSHADREFQQLAERWIAADSDCAEEVSALTMLFILRLRKYLASIETESIETNSDTQRVYHALQYMSMKCLGEISLEHAAKICGMSLVNFRRVFQKATGMPPHRYIHTLRIVMAKAQLVKGEHSIGEIAFRCGYGSLSGFNRHFKSLSGISPTEYMQTHKTD